ncbi:tripartite tricarboxylate transporter TctB family protein [Nonomuraea mesophila]|uniref:tripartite tricarboxylate transporter TctB family protein n=1 Tax=Nonomuraea mesophila TaxID=2530382 RepID=UPI00140A06B3|nr:tripartite tricarboxylate transporter TctB family protein [Nonomuraea mesophila]
MRGIAKPDVIAGGSLLVLGLLYGALALDEGLGTMADSGAGFFPFVVALALVAASAVVLLQSRRRTPAGPTRPEDAPDGDADGDADGDGDGERERGGEVRWWRIAGVLAAALLVPAVGDIVGMIVTLAVSLVLMAKVMGVSRWSSAVIFGFSFGAATWLIFVRWLLVPLPAGMLGLF